MARPKLPTDHEVFATEFSSIGAQGMASRYDVGIRNVFHRRRRAEEALGRTISVPAHLSRDKTPRPSVRQVLKVEKDLTILVGSDAHYEINTVTTAHLAFVELAKQLQPDVIVLNGDLLDGASISRHAPIGVGGEADSRARTERCPPTAGRNREGFSQFQAVLGDGQPRFSVRHEVG